MKVGDLVRYATSDIEVQIGDYPKTVKHWNNEGLLISFEERDCRFVCEILDSETGIVVRRHIMDVELVDPESEEEDERD